ncbi:MAG: imidazole glycerol phosphate synthase subunit HisH [Firmicutes bacterium]|nr:imidazole glycerol phosphate synthase subunit HisH [Bacillota bacterium]
MKKLIIVDSGCANLNSIYKASRAAGLNPFISDDSREIYDAGAIIFPGVGSFDHAIEVIKQKELIEPLCKAIKDDKPFLGICLGMQLLFSGSEESLVSNIKIKGLELIAGKAVRFPNNLPVPHVGWNQVEPVYNHPLFAGLTGSEYFYFTHSYYVSPASDYNVLAKTEYGLTFTSAVVKDSLIGVQFHPEKSGPAGLRLLANFGKIIADQ